MVLVAGFGRCWAVAGTALEAGGPVVGVGRGDRDSTCFQSLSMVLVRWRICFCVSASHSLMSLRLGILTVVDWLAN